MAPNECKWVTTTEKQTKSNGVKTVGKGDKRKDYGQGNQANFQTMQGW